jgi:hypothetical protein
MKAPSYPALLLSTLLLAVQGFNPIGRPVLTRAIHKRPLLNEARQVIVVELAPHRLFVHQQMMWQLTYQVTLFLRPEDEGEYFQSEQEKLPPMERMKVPKRLAQATYDDTYRAC